MPLVIGAFTAGSVISATTIRTKIKAVESYVNGEIANGDKSAAWMVPNHVFRSDFYGGSNPHSTLTSGQTYYNTRNKADAERSWWSSYLGQPPTTHYPVPGLNRCVQIPEDINTNGGHRVRVFASFYAYEFGGVDGVMNEEPASCGAMSFALLNGGSVIDNMTFMVCKGSSTSADQSYAFYPRKQVTFLTDIVANEGVYNFGIGIAPFTPLSADLTKHCVVVQGTILARYYCR
jgi:hypothetical protein